MPPLFSATWEEIVRISFILLVVIAIHVCHKDLGGLLGLLGTRPCHPSVGISPTIAKVMSSPNTCFTVCLDTSFTVFGVELGPESSARRSSSAGFRGRVPG